ncbi:MAG: acetyl-CoA carboxylase carboxyltransferase subunit alpha [Candidatus Eisenbacteria bacterium]|nr:acetyl-CoA carboxylase carboxyltransferase subunit alpha [Candidatus Eisenbacteria bacterium]
MSTPGWLEFEKPIVELEARIEELRQLNSNGRVEVAEEIESLERKAERLQQEIYSNLNRWQRVQLARHPRRPYALDYIDGLSSEFTELHGDRLFGDDRAIVGGFGFLDDRPTMFIGHQKGRNTKDNILRNFGMPHPEGYRKALRLMDLAGRFGAPIVTLVDTPGAYPGVGAEERGQSEAIARNLRDMARIPVPIVTVVIGEGGSGGALAIAVADVILMMENSIYSVISPEGCAAILWGDRTRAPEAAEALKLTATDLGALGIIDDIVPEPIGGAHRDPPVAVATLKTHVAARLESLRATPVDRLLKDRLAKYRRMGSFQTKGLTRPGDTG